MGSGLPQEKIRKSDLSADTPLRCNNCKRHRVAWTEYFWLCSRLSVDPDTGDEGCGRMFQKFVYDEAAGNK